MKNNSKKIRYVTYTAVIAAIYVVLTYLTNLFGLANGAVQCRLSEAMCILPAFTPAAVPGLFIGCLLSNIFTGCPFPDVIFGSIATLAGAFATLLLVKKNCSKFLLPVPTVISNTVIIPLVLKYAYGLEGGLLYFVLTVGIGEIVSCQVLGILLYTALKNKARLIFK